ncbi:scrFIAM [Symbiodinium natans]|uniref:ScrFIAM protein n=1 Tax=Symbiodinium natans TaxID=878477 RepID=A0A812IGA9_9DINO|nr:scrFIAM [Symbiodinium natans]
MEAVEVRTSIMKNKKKGPPAPPKELRVAADCSGYGAHAARPETHVQCAVAFLFVPEAKIIALANMDLKIPVKNMLACEIDPAVRRMASRVSDAVDLPAYEQPVNMVERHLSQESLELYMLTAPCQSYSLAGKGLGLGEGRGQLVVDGCGKILDEKPKAFLFENVANIDKQHKPVLDKWESILNDAGYVACLYAV